MTKYQELVEKIEALIDANSPNQVLSAIVDVCYAKAEHIETNWQNYSQAREWSNIAKRLDKLTVLTQAERRAANQHYKAKQGNA